MTKPKSSTNIAIEVEKTYKRNRKLLLASMSQTMPGTRAHLDHINALAALDRKYREERSDRGLDPKNLGSAAKPEYHFVATVSADGTVEISEEREEFNAKLDEEFSTATPTTKPRRKNPPKGKK
jgi:hypothetical protein